MNKKSFLVFLFSLFTFHLFSQPYSAFVNVKGELLAFDGASVQQLDYLQPQVYKAGGNCVAFIDNTKNFKVFWQGKVITLNEGYTTDFEPTKGLLLIRNSATLYAFDNGRTVLLSIYSSNNVAGDSLIGFFDNKQLAYKLYANGRIITLEENTVEFPLAKYAMGSNIFGYVTPYNEFKIWYGGAVYEQESQSPLSLFAGKNIMAYTDHFGSFRIFYKGETQDIESFTPKQIQAGDNLVGYTNNLGELKIFYDGRVYDTNVFNPKTFSVSHNLVAYENGSGGFAVFYKGKITQLENYVPADVQMGDNTLFYFDQAKQLKVFSFGRAETLPNQVYDSARIDFDVIQLKIGFNQYRFYYDGKIF